MLIFLRNNISILLGNEYQKSQNQYSSLNAIDALGPFYEQADLDTTLTLTSPSSRYSFVSYFARGKYSIKDKYFVQGTMRVDGSSRFGANNQYGYFPLDLWLGLYQKRISCKNLKQ